MMKNPKQKMHRQILAGGAAIWMGISTGLCGEVPLNIQKAFLEYKPNTGKMELVAQAKTTGGNYYVVWGTPIPPEGEQADSDIVDEAAFKENLNGEVSRINGNNLGIPANNYIANETLAKALNASFVEHRTLVLGGKTGAQAFLDNKSFITRPEAEAWVGAGFKFTDKTRLVGMNGQPPFQPISTLETKIKGKTKQTPKSSAPDQSTHGMEW